LPQGFIRIISRPPGGAPDKIRDQWIGLVLPIEQETDVLLADVLTYKLVPSHRGGYEVLWDSAMNELGKHSPEARKWWEENVSGFSTLVFSRDCCELLAD